MASPDPDNGFVLVSHSEVEGGVDTVDEGEGQSFTDSVENGIIAISNVLSTCHRRRRRTVLIPYWGERERVSPVVLYDVAPVPYIILQKCRAFGASLSKYSGVATPP